MSRAHLIYPVADRVSYTLNQIENDPCNKTILLRYWKVRKTQVQDLTLVAEFSRLTALSKMLGREFVRCTKKDVDDLNYQIEGLENAIRTKNKYRVHLRAFFTWLKGRKKGDYPPIVRDIALKKVSITPVKAKHLVPLSEVIRVSNQTTNLKVRAFIQNTADAAGRVGEILTSTIGEIRHTKYGVEIDCDGKTGDGEPLVYSWSTPTLMQWLNVHPFRDDPDAPIYPAGPYDKPKYWQYFAARKAFMQCVKRAKVEKKMWLHLLKHIGCTEDVKNGMPDGLRKFKHHHSQDSRMDKVYIHLASSIVPKIQKYSLKDRDIEERPEPEEEKIILTRKCRRCDYENPRESGYCNRCTFPLDDKKIALIAAQSSKINDLLEKISKNPEKFEKILSQKKR